MPAVSIIQQPSSTILSANNDAVFTVTGSSYTTASRDFQYLADVIVNGARIATLTDFPTVSNGGYGSFNLRELTPSLISYDFIYNLSQDTASIFHTASNSSAHIQLSFGKQYSLVGNGFTQSRNEVSSSVFTVINSALTFVEQVNTNLSASYLITSATSSTANFLTKANFTIPAYANLRSYLYYCISSSVNTYLSIQTFDANNNTIGIYYVGNTIGAYNGMQFVATGYPQLGSLISGSNVFAPGTYIVSSGNSDMFNSAVSSYVVQLIGDNFIPFSKKVTYQITQDCSKFAPYAFKVFFQNRLGGFDSWLFNKVNTISVQKTTSPFKRLPGTFNSNGTFTYQTYDRGNIPFFSQVDTKYTCTTDFLTDQQVLFLKDLYSSPVIFLETPEGNLISATIDDSVPYVINRKPINSKTFSLSITFNASVSDYRQAQ